MNDLGKLFLVPTPIGNLKDITLRALEILKSVDVIFAEDTRSFLKLSNHYDIKKQVKSLHKDNELTAIKNIFNLLKSGLNIAIVSEAGTPCISDPGSILIKELTKENIEYEVLPGANAVIPALIKSGFSSDTFYFKGFLSHKKSEKVKEIISLKRIKSTIVIYESPHRIKDTLKLLIEHFKNICVVRELTKVFEERIYIENIADIDSLTLKGEFVIVVDNNEAIDEDSSSNLDLNIVITKLKAEGFDNKSIIKISKILGFKRNLVYKILNQSN